VAQLLQTLRGPIELEVEPGLPEILVDRLQIELLMRNLISNAVDALSGQAHPGRIRISARRQDAQHVRIVVADNGPGIPSASAQRVFEPFVSGKSSGMGLGLAVSRAIAEAHGGSLDSHSGSHGEFHLVLPVEAPHG
jgi:signal transduction histidine kinase